MKEESPHYLGHKKRLREKFLKSGLDALADYEAVELILSMAIVRKDVKALAKKLLKRFGSFAGILDASMKELCSVEGIGESSASAILLIKESSKKYLQERSRESCFISSPTALIDYCKTAMKGLRDEQFRVIFLNTKNEVIDDEVLCEGTIDQTAVYPRKIIERTIHHGAASLIFVHNHPSGHTAPSDSDKELTKVLKEAAASIQVKVHDHLIIGKNSYYSFTEEGVL